MTVPLSGRRAQAARNEGSRVDNVEPVSQAESEGGTDSYEGIKERCRPLRRLVIRLGVPSDPCVVEVNPCSADSIEI